MAAGVEPYWEDDICYHHGGAVTVDFVSLLSIDEQETETLLRLRIAS